MKAHASADGSFIEETLIIEAEAVSARRKRTEIRRFKQMAYSANGVNKRSRPLGVTVSDLSDAEQVKSPLSTSKPESEGNVPLASEFVAGIKENEILGQVCVSEGSAITFMGGALIRSASFPPEGWERSARFCVLKISKTSRGSTALGGEHLSVNSCIKDGLGGVTKDVSRGSCASWPAEVARGSSPGSCNSIVKDDEQQGKKLEACACEVTYRVCLMNMTCPPNAKVLVCGRRREMEDTAAVVPAFTSLPCKAMGGCYCDDPAGCEGPLPFHFFGVYDGHGGAQVSKYCMERLHLALAEEASRVAAVASENGISVVDGWQSHWEGAMIACFLKMDKEVGGICPAGECTDSGSSSTCCVDTIAPDNVGSTAVVAVVGPCQIIIGNCGDSRAVLSRGGRSIPLSREHKPDREDETNRIEAAGGRVIFWDGYRVGGLLAMSRAIGDRYLKQYVISEPEVTCMQRSEEDECLILASDGLWDVVSNDVACDIARRCLATGRRKRERGHGAATGEDAPTAAVAALLVKLALARGSKDNISVVVVDLKSR